MKDKKIRGIPIGAVLSQTLGNLSLNHADQKMKFNHSKAAYFRYCDDVVGFARTKAEAIRDMTKFYHLATDAGVVIKANVVLSPIGRNKTNEDPKRKRKRQRGGKWKKNRLSGILLHT